jgi:hypothetical protein
METGTNSFVRYRSGGSVFAFRCPVCGTTGELGVPDGNRNRLVPCPNRCGAQFMARSGRGAPADARPDDQTELLRRVSTMIGEALIANEIADTAVAAFAGLQDEITAAIGQPESD